MNNSQDYAILSNLSLSLTSTSSCEQANRAKLGLHTKNSVIQAQSNPSGNDCIAIYCTVYRFFRHLVTQMPRVLGWNTRHPWRANGGSWNCGVGSCGNLYIVPLSRQTHCFAQRKNAVSAACEQTSRWSHGAKDTLSHALSSQLHSPFEAQAIIKQTLQWWHLRFHIFSVNFNRIPLIKSTDSFNTNRFKWSCTTY